MPIRLSFRLASIALLTIGCVACAPPPAADAEPDRWRTTTLLEGDDLLATAAAGDVNGDGRPDFLVGSQENEAAAILLGGSDGTWEARWLDAPRGSDAFGREVVGPGDLNGDDLDDAIIRAYEEDNTVYYLYLGGADGLTFAQRLEVGSNSSSIEPVGDVDGDGNADLVAVLQGNAASEILDTPFSAGELHLFRGTSGELGAEPVATGIVEPQYLLSAAGLGDLDGDELADVFIGGHTVALVAPGGPTGLGTPVIEDAVDPGFSLRTEPAGDVDGDGFGDFVVTRYWEEFAGGTTTAAVYIVAGTDEGLGAVLQTLGIDLSAIGDVDCDGYADLAARAYPESWVVYGGPTWPLSTTAASEDILTTVEGRWTPAGDEDGDGCADILTVQTEWPDPNRVVVLHGTGR